MSLIEIFLQQKLILITLGLAAALFGFAVFLAVYLRVRLWVLHRRERRRAEQAEEETLAVSELEPVVVVAPPKPAPVIQQAPEPEATEPEVNEEMQNLLNDVFVDEEAMERFRILLKDTHDIDVNQLLAQSQQILKALKAG